MNYLVDYLTNSFLYYINIIKMDQYIYNVNYRLFNGQPCNNYYTKTINNITYYYDEFLTKLNDKEIEALGIHTLTVINDIPMNITDVENIDGDSKNMIGGAKQLIVDPNIIATKKAEIENEIKRITSKSSFTKFRTEFKKYFDLSDADYKSNLLDIFSDIMKIKNISFKVIETNFDAAIIQKALIQFLNTNNLYEQSAPINIDVANIDLSTIHPLLEFKGKQLTRGFAVEAARLGSNDIQEFDYESKLDGSEINLFNDAKSIGVEKFNLLLKTIYPLLIQSNPNQFLKKEAILDNNKIVINHIINTKQIIYKKYMLGKSLSDLVKTKKGDISILEDIISKYIRDDGTSLFQKYMFFFNKVVKCINTYCYRPAASGAVADTTKQRQECNKCTKYRKQFYANNGSHVGIEKDRPLGVIISMIKHKNKKNKEKYKNVYIFECQVVDIELIYEKFCYNNRNKSYWYNLGQRELYKRGAIRNTNAVTEWSARLQAVRYIPKLTLQELAHSDDPKVVGIVNAKSLYYIDYPSKDKEIIEERKPGDKRKKAEKVITNIEVYDVSKPLEENIYFCELSNSHESYPSDIIEIDHVNGNHQDNRPDNIQPLCKMCHAIKTFLAQDKAESGTSISAMDAYIAELCEGKKQVYDKICGFFYLQYVKFCKDVKYDDKLIGETSNLTTSLMGI